MASFYQGPIWTLPWYRAYAGSFDPLVLTLEAEGQLLGVVPLAVERRRRRLAFAGDVMADYRDVVALPGHREDVIRALLRLCRARGEARFFRIGPTLPESNTAEIAMRICASENVRAIYRKHLGWRWLAAEAKDKPDPLKKRAVRYSLNYLRRTGAVAAEVICSRERWDEASDEFFVQHSLRQLYGNRPISFDDAQKRRFFHDMFETPLSHVTVLTVNGKAIAGHYGYRWKDVLYWAAPWFDFREQQYSPGLLLVLLTMKRAEEWGLTAFDLTEGEGYLKERFSTNCVPLSIVELYSRRSRYLRRRARDRTVRATRRLLRLLGSESAWRGWARPALAGSANVVRTAAGMRPRQAFRYVSAVLRGWRPSRTITLRAPDNETLTQAPLAPGHEIRTNEIADLLKGTRAPLLRSQVSRAARKLSKARDSDFHTLLRNGKLVAWGCSRRGNENEAVLHDFDAAPGEEAALATLLVHVMSECRRNGASQVRLLATNLDRAALRAFTLAVATASRGTRSSPASCPTTTR
jgi:CelD/BcsL family acetyltransferase involved in cellulose biosynthesis